MNLLIGMKTGADPRGFLMPSPPSPSPSSRFLLRETLTELSSVTWTLIDGSSTTSTRSGQGRNVVTKGRGKEGR